MPMAKPNILNDRPVTESNTDSGSSSCRLPYSSPTLREFGPVGALTQAGTGLSSEVMQNGMRSMSPSQRA